MSHSAGSTSHSAFAARFIAVLFAAVLITGLCGCSAAGLGTGANASSTTIAQANKAIVPDYEHYDPTAFNELCDQLTNAASAEQASTALDLYDSALEQLEYLCTLDSVAYIMFCEDVSNAEYEEEYLYCDNTLVECCDRFFQAAHSLAIGTHAEAFKAHVNNDAALDAFATYEPMTQEEKDLAERETALTNTYYEIISNTADYSYEYEGHSYTLDSLESDVALAALGTEGYTEVYGGCVKQLNEALGATFTELVSVRTQIAQLNGYADYCEYADAELYSRDYTEAELESFRTAVRTFSVTGTLADPYELTSALPDYTVTTKTLFSDAATAVGTVSSYATEALSYLQENGLSSIGSEDSRLDSGFTTSLYSPARSAFIYNCTNGDLNDLCGTIHELGHFTNMTRSSQGILDEQAVGTCLDVSEIHSTGLELLAGRHFESVIDQRSADATSAWLAASAVETVIEGCIFDEWQRIVYRNPTMSMDEINEAFRSTLSSYGMVASDAYAYSWVSVNHNFDAPLYYISYATSYFASLQLWNMADTDESAAARIWEQAVDCAPGTGYLELCNSAGLISMADQSAVTQTLSDISAKLNDAIATIQSSAERS